MGRLAAGVALAAAAAGCVTAEQGGRTMSAGGPPADQVVPVAPAAPTTAVPERGPTPDEVVAREREAAIRAGARPVPPDLPLVELKLDAPLALSAGQATLRPAPPDVRGAVAAAQLFLRFVERGLPADARGRAVEALFGLYTDKAYGVQKDGGEFTPTLVDRKVWLLRVRGVTIAPSGPPGAKHEPVAGGHDHQVLYDADTGAELLTIQEPTRR
jgi:hypothetical protein